MSKDISYEQVVQFVKRNTRFEKSRWCQQEEIVWVLSWYQGADKDTIRQLLERAVANGTLKREGTLYTDPTPRL